MHPTSCALALIATLTAAAAFATTVHRCEDVNGHVTFTHLGCPTDQQLHMQSVESPSPGGAIATQPIKPEKTLRQSKPQTTQERRAVAGTGERQDGCGNQITGSARRKAMIDKEVRPGMTRADVESMLGKPNSISSQNGKVRYNYADKNTGRKRSVTFDSEGCVKS